MERNVVLMIDSCHHTIICKIIKADGSFQEKDGIIPGSGHLERLPGQFFDGEISGVDVVVNAGYVMFRGTGCGLRVSWFGLRVARCRFRLAGEKTSCRRLNA
jgi:hypothetical protein